MTALASPVDSELTAGALAATVLAARTEPDWAASIERYGPALLASTALIHDFAGCIVQAKAEGRNDDAERLDRWRLAAQQARPDNRLKQQLAAARTDAELDRLIATHSAAIDRPLVSSALDEVQHLLSPAAGMPAGTALATASRILWVALRLAEQLRDPELIIGCLNRRSQIAQLTGDLGSALADISRAADVARAAGSHFQAGRCLSIAGSLLVELDRADEGLAALLASIGPLRQAADLPGAGPGGDMLLGSIYAEIAELYRRRGDDEQWLSNLGLAVSRQLAAGQHDRALPIQSLLIGGLLARRQPDRALPFAEELLAGPTAAQVDPELADVIRRAAVSQVTQAFPEADFLLGRPYRSYLREDQQPNARRWLTAGRRAQALAPTDEGAAFLDLAAALLALSAADQARASELAGQARDWFAAQRRWPELAGALTVLAGAAAAAGDMIGAAGYLDDSLALPDLTPVEKATMLSGQGQFFMEGGDPRAARRSLAAALDQARRAPDNPVARASEGSALTSLAALHTYLGDAQAAARAYGQAHKIAVKLGHRRGVAATFEGMGVLLGKALNGRFGPLTDDRSAALLAALDLPAAHPGSLELTGIWLLEQAVATFRDIHDEDGWAKAASDLSNFLTDDQSQWRLRILAEVLDSERSRGNRRGQAVTLANIGAAKLVLGDRAAAGTAFRQSLDISRALGFAESGAASARSLGHLAERDGNRAEAMAWYAESIEMIERLRIRLPADDAGRIGFGRDKDDAYLRLVDLLVADGRYDEAFELVQRAKSRALLDLVGATVLAPTVPPQGRYGELLAQEARCLAVLRAAARADSGPPAQSDDGSAAADRLDALYAEMTSYDPQYVAMRRGTPVTLADLRGWLGGQSRPVLLADYVVTDQAVIVFGLRADWPGVQVRVTGCTAENLREGYADFRRQVIQYRSAAGQSWTRLSAQLTEPLRDWLRPGDLVCLVPHGILHALPIHALPVGDSPLIAGYPVVYAPAAGIFPLMRNAAKGSGTVSSCASIGVVFAEEASAVARLFGTEPVDTTGLTADRVAAICAGQDVCHFSCHGVFNPSDPLSSGLLLGDTGAATLTARDVMGIRLDAELVCLSACQSGVSEVAGGDELIGLIRAFLYAGTPSIIASLWSADADATRDLMIAFYRALRAQPPGMMDKAQALRAAQLDIMRDAGERAVYRWAPFALTGDWR
jgi:hypothetical protein